MSDAAFAKCPCRACGLHLEFPIEAAGASVNCPQCNAETELTLPTAGAHPQADYPDTADCPTAQITTGDLLAAFTGPVEPTPVSFLYKVGLTLVTVAMLILPLIYFALVAAAGWAVYWWGVHGTFLFSGGGGARAGFFKLLLYLAPLFSGVVVVFFMIKPLLARRAPRAQPLALNSSAEPVLFAFIAKICDTVGAPFPKRIDLDCQLNASAGFRRGFWSFLGNDLVLTIGLPLAAGLTARQFAGVLAHEFGHFTQGVGMRLTYLIRSVNGWFARVAYERDAWDLLLEEWAQTEDWRAMILVNFARLAVWFSRLILKLLMFIGHGLGCFMLRQMEYDADSYEIKLAGSEDFESTSKRMHVLGEVTGLSYKAMRVGWNRNRRLPDNFPAFLLRNDDQLQGDARTRIEDASGLEKTGLFDTHPSNGDRIRAARVAARPGIFHLEGPATALFTNFDAVAKQVTLLHYSDDLGFDLDMVKLAPLKSETVAESASEPETPSDAPSAQSDPPRLKLKARS